MISESFAKDYVKAGEVKLLTVEGVDLWRELGLVYRRDRSLPRAAQALVFYPEPRRACGPERTDPSACNQELLLFVTIESPTVRVRG